MRPGVMMRLRIFEKVLVFIESPNTAPDEPGLRWGEGDILPCPDPPLADGRQGGNNDERQFAACGRRGG
ncbi:hypothetical protein D3C73_1437630 [compost metagenome]